MPERASIDLADARHTIDALRAERDHYRAALVRIGNNESGHWGVIAREALRNPPTPTTEG
jgi:hypothetical protein